MAMANLRMERYVSIIVDEHQSACRLCLRRNRAGERMVWVKVTPSGLLSAYCFACYDYLRERGVEAYPSELSVLPSSADLTGNARRGAPEKIVIVPAYLIRNDDFLSLLHPTDPIDIGLLRQRRAKEGWGEAPKEEP
jgi:hypothetical protein